MSLRRHVWPSIRYSLSPDRNNRRVTSTSRVVGSISSATPPPWPLASCTSTSSPISLSSDGGTMTLPKRRRTSAAPVGLRASEPEKMTSSILSPRRLLALCSPSTHVSASATLLLPQPLGPTMAVTPRSNASSDRSEKDLKPEISNRSRCIAKGSGGNARQSNKHRGLYQEGKRPQHLGAFAHSRA